ncbi:hypothetical protein [Natrinema versiforme]|uniref:Uncharacterized protein n=1 Tax=Natrinema versiforme JCM 10478 TaxID=1227496 RepID=L9XY01_9EURY|nr:hypothetical protein [Natrinema versiforme]ELY66306.1 hypothetical protein C489_13131 [Natrinema versiforme JCM 10478]
MELYSDPKDFLTRDVALVVASVIVVLLLNFQQASYLANGQEVPGQLTLANFPALGLLLWTHWRVEFDIVADLFKLELSALGASILGGAAVVSVVGTPTDALAGVETRIFIIASAVFLYSSVCSGISVANHTLRDDGKDVPDPGDF